MTTSVKERSQTPALALIDGFVLDCLISDNHSFDAEVTEFPVESGSTISDNIRPKPLVVAMEALISDTPLTSAGQFRNAGSIPSVDAYALFLSIRRERRLISITTSIDTYDNMALESLSVPRSSGRGEDFRFNATFKQVTIVQNKRETRVAIPGASQPSSSNDSLKNENTKDVYADFANATWYDQQISDWRKGFYFDFGQNGAQSTATTKNFYILYDGKPLHLTQDEWDIFRETSKPKRPTTAKTRDFTLQKQGGKPLPILKNNDPRHVYMLHPGQYKIMRGAFDA